MTTLADGPGVMRSVMSAVGVGVLTKKDGSGVNEPGTVGVGVSWMNGGSVGVPDAAATKVRVGEGWPATNKAMAPPTNSIPASSTAPNATRPCPPPPCGSVVSVRRYAMPAPRAGAAVSLNAQRVQKPASGALLRPQFGQIK
jgi:hypothetical protein